MKIKYNLKGSLLFLHLLLLLTVVRFFIGLYDIFRLIEMIVFIIFILFEILFIGYIFFGTRVIIGDNIIISKYYFFKKTLNIDSSTKVIIKPFLRFLRKRLIIITNGKTIILWDFYSMTLESICDEINKRISNNSVE